MLDIFWDALKFFSWRVPVFLCVTFCGFALWMCFEKMGWIVLFKAATYLAVSTVTAAFCAAFVVWLFDIGGAK